MRSLCEVRETCAVLERRIAWKPWARREHVALSKFVASLLRQMSGDRPGRPPCGIVAGRQPPREAASSLAFLIPSARRSTLPCRES